MKLVEVSRGWWADYNRFYLHFSDYRLFLLISAVNGSAWRAHDVHIERGKKVNTIVTGLIECSII